MRLIGFFWNKRKLRWLDKNGTFLEVSQKWKKLDFDMVKTQLLKLDFVIFVPLLKMFHFCPAISNLSYTSQKPRLIQKLVSDRHVKDLNNALKGIFL